MSTLAADLAALLAAVKRPGDFYFSGTAPLFSPNLEVEGVGQIALPLRPRQAGEIIAVAERAPYGKGEQTIVDTKVRRTWQLGPDKVRIGGKYWAGALDDILSRLVDGLGMAGDITAEFYKLLVYDEGSFFSPHRDSEKVAGMFGTLVIVLPGQSSGGELVIRHDGRDVVLDLRREDAGEIGYAAFYADCLHEVRPVTTGCRLTLVYNLIRTGKGKRPLPPDHTQQQEGITKLLRPWDDQIATRFGGAEDDAAADWDDDIDDDEDMDDEEFDEDDAPTPLKLVYPLKHAYSEAELSFAALKGTDAAAAGCLRNAAADADCELRLALLSVEEFGFAEYAQTSWSSRRRHREPEFAAGEVEDGTVELSHWFMGDGEPLTAAGVPVGNEEISPPEALEDADDDNVVFHEATGNEGVSFARSYRRAALVLWPKQRLFQVLARGGLKTTLPYLATLTARAEVASPAGRPELLEEARSFAARIIAVQPALFRAPYDRSPHVETALKILARLGDAGLVHRFVHGVMADGAHKSGDNPALIAALALLPVEDRLAAVEQLVKAMAESGYAACADLLARLTVENADLGPGLRGAAAALTASLPGKSAHQRRDAFGDRVAKHCDGEFVLAALSGLARIDESLAATAVDTFLAWPKTYDFDAALVPAACGMIEDRALLESAAVTRLREACLGHLAKRIAVRLEPPSDWRRAAVIACGCEHCCALNTFLRDPREKEWTLRARQDIRSHVESGIRDSKPDLVYRTLAKGNPHSLICTKNQASYEARVVQRREDLKHQQALLAH